MAAASPNYGGLDPTQGDLEDDWLQVSDHKSSTSSLQALEIQNENSSSSSFETDSDEEEEYELTSGRRATRFSSGWRPKELVRCCIICLVLILVGVFAPRGDNGLLPLFGSSHPPPGAVGVGHSSYDTLQSTRLTEYEARLTLYRHRATGAEFLAFVPDKVTSGFKGGVSGEEYDPKPDKVFGVAFRTKPESSTGVPHILEHSVLCGSKKYPSRDPFAHLLKGSLQTFLNAMTYPDRTVYPVASRNRADFRNLMDVYLDAVFHPRAVTDEGWWVLRQEGWRYDVADSGDERMLEDKTSTTTTTPTTTTPTTTILTTGTTTKPSETTTTTTSSSTERTTNARAKFEYKGVVFSEMKGAYSDPEGYLDRVTQELLFPDSPYHYDSGGDPAVIPTLTREEFVSFYKKYYHPTNARLFVAGDEVDVYHALSKADSYMTPMGYNPESRKDSAIPYQKRTFKKPLSERRPFAVAAQEGGESSEGFMLCITWLLNTQPLSPMMELAWIILDSLLLGKASSPLTKALEDSGLGEELIGGGVDDELLQSTFGIGMKGIKTREDVTALEDLIMDTLHQLDTDGFNDDEIASSMNTIEFQLREGGGGLRGMEIFLGALQKWNYDLNPSDALVYEGALKDVKDEISKTGSNLFQQMIHDFLITNNHRVVLELFPSTTLEADQLKDEDIQISRATVRMSDKEYQQVIDENSKLKELQETDETPEVIATNPALSISDIDKQSIEYPISVEEDAFKSGVRLITHTVTSSGILYVRFGLDVSMIPYNDLEMLPSLVTLMNEAGTHELTDAEFRNNIGKVTGGVSASLEIMTVKPNGWDDDAKVLPGVNMLTMLMIHGKCTSDKAGELFSIFNTILTDINIEDSKSILMNSLKSSLSSKKSSVASSGHSYANRRIRGRYSVRNFIDEKMYGVTSLDANARTINVVETAWTTFALRLEEIRKTIVNGNRNGMLLDMTGDAYVLEEAMESAQDFLLNKLPLDLGNPAPPAPDFRGSEHPWVKPAREEMVVIDPIRDEGIVVSTQVAYVGEGGQLFERGDTVDGSTSVVSHYLTTGYMWDVIRAKNGAYGAYSSFSHSDGVQTLYTYRDPNTPDITLGLFHDAADSILNDVSSGALTQKDNAAITTAVIGTIGSLDGSALSAEEAGWVALARYLRGESSVARQKWRNEVLNTNEDNFVDFANRMNSWQNPSQAIVASESAFAEMKERVGVELSLFKAQR